MMPRMRWLILVVACLGSACGAAPVAPTPQPPPAPACQTQNTAQLTMTNASPNNLTFDVLIDNIGHGSMAPGASIGPVTLTAGVNHVIVSRITNSAVVGCTSTTSFATCSTQSLTCRY